MVDLRWQEPLHAHYLRRLASFSRLILLDPRGSGASDPISLDPLPTWEDEVDDLETVLDAVASERVTIFACNDSGPLAMMFAATHPDRVRALALANTSARYIVADDYPIGLPAEQVDREMARIPEQWGTGEAVAFEVPSKQHDPDFRRWYARYQRAAARPRELASYMPMVHTLDVRNVLPSIRCPTLVLHRRERGWVGADHGRYIAEKVPGGRFVELPGGDVTLATEHPELTLGLIEELVTGSTTTPEADRVLATILFTDIVGSTERAAAIVDRAWRDSPRALLRRGAPRDRPLPRPRDRHGGRRRVRRVRRAGSSDSLRRRDGTGSSLARPRASHGRPYRRVRDSGRQDRRHRGDVERGDVNAGPGETLVSSTVRDLVAGSGIEFVDRGAHALRGIPGEWRLFSVARA